MAKKSMKIKYKSKKRQRNKYDPTIDTAGEGLKSFGKTLIGVAVFLGLMYLVIFGLEKLGLFQKGYTAPSKESTEFSYEYIPIGTVFTRSEKTYYVLFDNYKSNLTSDAYVNGIVDSLGERVYKVDMSLKENAKYISETANKKATRASELAITNDITLIKITNGKISEYYIGSDEIEEHFVK